MPVRSTTVTIGGTTFTEERDVDTNALLRRFRATFDVQSEKTRRRIELRERVEEWFMFKAFVDEAALPAHGEPAGAISTGRTQQEALYQAARSAYLDWMNTT
jgi:hypothetical protein